MCYMRRVYTELHVRHRDECVLLYDRYNNFDGCTATKGEYVCLVKYRQTLKTRDMCLKLSDDFEIRQA